MRIPESGLIVRSYKSAFLWLFSILMVVTVVSVSSNAYRRASEVSHSLSAELIDEMADKIVMRIHPHPAASSRHD